MGSPFWMPFQFGDEILKSQIGTDPKPILVSDWKIPKPILGSLFWYGDVLIPISVRGSPNRFGGSLLCASPFRFGDPRFGVGMSWSPFQFRDPRIGSGIHCYVHPHFGSGIPVLVWGCLDPHTGSGISAWFESAVSWLPKFWVRRGVPWCWDCLNFWWVFADLVRDWKKNTKKAIPKPILGLPESVWVGIIQYSKSGSPRIGLGSIPIWGPTHTRYHPEEHCPKH